MNCMDCGGSECICKASRVIRLLTEACQLLTQGLGDAEGYYPMLGSLKTKRALECMQQAGVTPIFAPGIHS